MEFLSHYKKQLGKRFPIADISIEEITAGFVHITNTTGLEDSPLESILWGVLIEHNYVCKDYRNLRSQFYTKKFIDVPPYCSRIHFFSNPGNLSSGNVTDFDVLTNKKYKKCYLGYSVIQPVRYHNIGRTVLDPLPFCAEDERKNFHCLRTKFKVDIMGVEFSVEGYPYFSQSSESMVCAHAALWGCCRYLSERHTVYKELKPYDLIQMTGDTEGRRTPERAMGVSDYSTIFSQFGCHPVILKPNDEKEILTNNYYMTKDKEFLQEIAAYVESGLPVLASYRGHVISLVGHTTHSNPVHLNEENMYGCYDSFDMLRRYIVVDDNYLPYNFIGTQKTFRQIYHECLAAHLSTFHPSKSKENIVDDLREIRNLFYTDYIKCYIEKQSTSLVDAGYNEKHVRLAVNSSLSLLDRLTVNSSSSLLDRLFLKWDWLDKEGNSNKSLELTEGFYRIFNETFASELNKKIQASQDFKTIQDHLESSLNTIMKKPTDRDSCCFTREQYFAHEIDQLKQYGHDEYNVKLGQKKALKIALQEQGFDMIDSSSQRIFSIIPRRNIGKDTIAKAVVPLPEKAFLRAKDAKSIALDWWIEAVNSELDGQVVEGLRQESVKETANFSSGKAAFRKPIIFRKKLVKKFFEKKFRKLKTTDVGDPLKKDAIVSVYNTYCMGNIKVIVRPLLTSSIAFKKAKFDYAKTSKDPISYATCKLALPHFI